MVAFATAVGKGVIAACVVWNRRVGRLHPTLGCGGAQRGVAGEGGNNIYGW